MELWIRSQDRIALTKINSIGIEYDKELIGYGKVCVKLGKYSTKERALEVLDEIQRILKPNIKAHYPIVESKEDYKNHCMKTELCGYTTEYDIIALPIYVYEMPEE